MLRQSSWWVVVLALAGCTEPEGGFSEKPDDSPLPAPLMVVEPLVLDFGALEEGQEEILAFTVRNDGTGVLELQDVVMNAPESFRIVSTYALPLELDVGGQIRWEVAYTPLAVNESGTVTVMGNDEALPEQDVQLIGTWSVPALEIEPTEVDFGELPPDCREETTMLLKSVGTGPLIINAIDLIGAGDGWGFVDPEAIVTPMTLDPGENYAVDVFFLPEEEREYLAALTVDSNDPAGRKEGSLAGLGLTGALCDGVMTYELEFEVDYKLADVAFLLDTTCSMSGTANAMASEFSAIASALQSRIPDITFGVVTYEDYNHGSFGSGPDLPFRLEQQQTSDFPRVANKLSRVTINGGADGPESSFEALYQAASGAGYDQDCDRNFDNADDVRPFVANPLDSFFGLVAGVFDPTVPGTGDNGGMGFRERVFPIFILATDNELRDPEAGYGSPGGCSLDATFYDTYLAMAELGGKFIGINTSTWNSIGRGQMEALAIVTGSLADMDGDYVNEPTVTDWNGSNADFRQAVVDAVYALTASAIFDKVHLEVDDPGGYILEIAPEYYEDIRAGTPITFTLTVAGKIVEVPSPTSVEIMTELVANDTLVLSRRPIYVEP